MPSYSEKLRDPRWQRRRLEIMQFARFRCEQCGEKDRMLSVHHRVYRVGSAPWAYPDHELACLCEECHHFEHHISEEDRAGLDSEARNEGYLDMADYQLERAKFDREAQRLGFEDDADRQFQEWMRSEAA